MDIASLVSTIIATLDPLVEVVSPGAAEVVAKVGGLINSAISGEHSAVALIEQIKSGTPATADQLKAHDAALDAAVARIDALDDAG
jgi:hypothetical protein